VTLCCDAASFRECKCKPENVVAKIQMQQRGVLFEPLRLPCGVSLKNRIAKSAMSDSVGDGTGHPTADQIGLYQRWAGGGSRFDADSQTVLTEGN